MTDEEDKLIQWNPARVPFDQWKDELEIRASQHSFNATVPLLTAGMIALAFVLFRGSDGKA